jgi:hypothetical protein
VVLKRHRHVDFLQQAGRSAVAGAEMARAAPFEAYGTGFVNEFHMRRIGWTLSLLAITVAGCASQPRSVVPGQQPVAAYSEANASALAFDPPVLAGTPRLDLSRDGREPTAFEGFDQGSTTYYFLQTYDLYSGFGGGRGGRGGIGDFYQRQAVSQTYGISYR